MTDPIAPSGADFDDDRDLGAARPGRLSRFIERVRSGPKRPLTKPAHVASGVGENFRVSEYKPARRPSPMPQRDGTKPAPSDPEEIVVAPFASPRRARRKIVVDDIIPAQPTAEDDAPYRGNWDHGRGSQRNVRDTIDPARDISYYDD